MEPQPLNDSEFDSLSETLERLNDKGAMNLEMLDGFFAALICGPENVLPSEWPAPIEWSVGHVSLRLGAVPV